MQKIRHFVFLCAALTWVPYGHADEIKGVTLSPSIKGETKTIAKKGESYKSVELNRVTQGLRQKKVALFWASVYVAQVFSNSKLDFTDISKLRESIVGGLPATVTMTFVRDVDIPKIVDGYTDVFKGNDVKIEEDPFKAFLTAVRESGDVKDRQVYQFDFMSDGAGKYEVKFRTKNKDQYTAKALTKEQLDSFLKMWFGKAVDSGLEQLQEQMLKPTEKI